MLISLSATAQDDRPCSTVGLGVGDPAGITTLFQGLDLEPWIWRRQVIQSWQPANMWCPTRWTLRLTWEFYVWEIEISVHMRKYHTKGTCKLARVELLSGLMSWFVGINLWMAVISGSSLQKVPLDNYQIAYLNLISRSLGNWTFPLFSIGTLSNL